MLCPTLWHANAPFNSCHRLSGVSGALTSKLMLSSNHINRTTKQFVLALHRITPPSTLPNLPGAVKAIFRHLLICSNSRASTKPKKPLSITPKYLLENFAQITQIYSYLAQLPLFTNGNATPTAGKSSLNRQHAPPYSISSHSYRPHTGSMTLTR